MTRIIKLEMKGFKSFARHTEFFFGSDFNVVIGPNGSGKSNVLDALTFVLGKSGAKGLRAEKTANLIYNGGKTGKPASQGEVSIYFDNKKKEFPIDSEAIKLTRIIKKTGQSQYLINDVKHTRTQILDLLHYAQINPDGYNIILQGDIVRFVEMSGEQRRQIIEQIADISVYEEKKHKALLELDKVEASLKEASIILKERKSYLNDLSKEKEQATQYQKLEETIKRSKATILTKTITSKEKEIESIHEKNKSDVEKRNALQEKIDANKKQIANNKEQIVAINKEIEAKGDKEQVQIHKQIEQFKIEKATNSSTIESISEELKKIKDRKQQLVDSEKEMKHKAQTLKSEIGELQNRHARQTKLFEEAQAKVTELRKKHKLEGANEIEEKLDTLDKAIEEKQTAIDILRQDQQESLRLKDKLEVQIQNADEKINKVLSVSAENKKEIEQLKQKKIELKKITVELSKTLTQDSQIVSQLDNARSRVNFLQEELAKLQARKASIQETLGGSIAISKIIENKNKIGGVYGTIASLGSVDQKYAKALEIAAGGKIKGIVVESDAVAQKCIEFLKSNRLGVAMFLPLNKIVGKAKDTSLQSVAQSAEGFAIDHIKFDKKFLPAFSNVFGSTIVVKDISQARKIGIGKARMVSLDGDLAETSGVMSGGHRKEGNTGMTFTNKDVDEKSSKYEKELADAQSMFHTLTQKKNANLEDIDRLRELKATLEGEVIKTEKSLHLDDSDLEMSKELKKEFQKDLQDHDKRYMEISNKISLVNRELAQLKIEKQKHRDTINQIRNPVKLAELTTFEEQGRKYKEENIRIESEIKHLTNQLQNILEPELENIQKIIKQYEKEESDYKGRITLIKNLISDISTKLKELEEKEKEFYAKFKEIFAKRQKLSDDIEKLEDQTIKAEDSIREFERKVNVVTVQVAKIQAEVDMTREELKEFKDVEPYALKSIDECKKDVAISERELQKIGPVNLKAVQMYDKMNEEYEKLTEKQNVLLGEKDNVLIMINEIEVRKKDLFLKVFQRLNANFQKIFQSLSTKGEAFIELENPEQPFEGGVNVKVKLTGNKFMDIRSLSGGEKTMTALAFIFAIQENDPASFYILDEVDAALDKRNAEKLAELVEQYCSRAQYIVISHNDGVISHAHNLYGVSMDQQSGVSKVVSLKL